MSTNESDEAYISFAKDLEQVEHKNKLERKNKLQTGILQFEKDTKKVKGIQSKLIHQNVSKLREEAGMSPFVGSGKKIKPTRFSKTKYKELLKREILAIGLNTKANDELVYYSSTLLQFFQDKRPNWEVKMKDLQEAIFELADEKLIPKPLKTEHDFIIFFKPIEMDPRVEKLLKIIVTTPSLTIDKLRVVSGWQKEEIMRVTSVLETLGIIIRSDSDLFYPAII